MRVAPGAQPVVVPVAVDVAGAGTKFARSNLMTMRIGEDLPLGKPEARRSDERSSPGHRAYRCRIVGTRYSEKARSRS